MKQEAHKPRWAYKLLGFLAASLFGVSLAFNHLYAGIKAQYGLAIYMLVNPETKRAYAAWAFIDAHKWIGLLYIVISLAIPLFVRFRLEPKSITILLSLSIFVFVGAWYWWAMAYLGGKFIHFGNEN